MVAAFFQIHHDVEQGCLIAASLDIQGFIVSGKYVLVIFPIGREMVSGLKDSSLSLLSNFNICHTTMFS